LVTLDDDDLVSLGLENPETKRVIVENITRTQAFQINGPVGEDQWKKISHIEIRDNTAGSLSSQVNYPVSKTVFFSLLADHFFKYVILATVLYLIAASVLQKKE
jgi:hypothetical protein